MKKIEKSIGRDLSLLNIYAWHISYTGGMFNNLGWSYSDTLFYVHEGATEIMRVRDEVYVDFKNTVISKIKNDNTWFDKECEKVINQTEELEVFFESNKDLSSKSTSELWNIYQKYCDLIEAYTSRFIMMFWFPIWTESDSVMARDLAREMSVCFDVRKRIEKTFPLGDVLIDNILEKLNKEWKIDKSLLRVVSHEEFSDFVNKNIKPDEALLKIRQNGFIYSRFGIKLVDNKPASLKKLIAEIGYDYEIDNIDYEKVKELKGSSACRGIISGPVRVILTKSKISDIKDGEILVASMTTPEYLPAMKKAAAFVTDEGGITCHAAIVARELKKPCIIGTKIASKVLKDGDMVEVDADKGVIKIL